ncbi:MAG: protein kinase [Myxococcota bacterium]
MMNADMPTLDGDAPGDEQSIGLLATHYGGKTPLSERFRRAQLRAQMFGDAGEPVTIGRYTITGRIGAGAMGTVYRAEDTSLERAVAIKVLHRSDEMYRARMTVEAKALAKLSHPNVVTVHEVGTDDGQLFVAMELVQGRTLHAWLEDPSGLDVLDVFAQAAQGLQAAHDAGIVHRDFKPENVMIGDDGRVRVLDFGMARTPGAALTDDVEGAPSHLDAREPAITRTGMLAGTPTYMAPEQFEGARVDAKADQFAFCIALHEAIWGVRPFAGDTVGTLARSVTMGEATLFSGPTRPDLPAHHEDAIRAVIERGLRTDPADRFDSMRALVDRLRSLPIPASASPPPRRLKLTALLSSALLLLVGLTIYRQIESHGAEAPPPLPEAAQVSAPAPRCGLGTELRNGACIPLGWDPRMVECSDDGCTVSRSLFLARGDKPSIIESQIRVVPVTGGGFKVYGVRPGTAAHMLGFEVGDMLLRVNDIDLMQGTDAVIPLLDAARRGERSVDALKFEIKRGGELKSIQFRLE